MTAAVVIGQSHTEAIVQGLGASRALPITVLRLNERNPSVGERPASFATAQELVASLPNNVPVFLSILGTYHNILGLLRSGETFDFMVDQADRLVPGGSTLVPHRAISCAFDRHLDGISLVNSLRSVATSPVYVISTPPPKQSSRFMLHRFMRHKHPWYRGKSVVETGIERPATRLKLWRFEAALVEMWARSQYVGFLPAPPAAFNEDGFLARKYYSDDVTHANGLYGELVVQQILTILEKSGKQVANG